MNYKYKYNKYFFKYENINKMHGGGEQKYKFKIGDELPLGINFEGGKIIKFIREKFGNKMAGYSNFQISMDAPFHGMEANDNFRSKGPSEKYIKDYNYMDNESSITNALMEVINFACTNNVNTIVIQIARGRSGIVFFNNDIVTKLKMLGSLEFIKIIENKYFLYDFSVCNIKKKIILTFGYRSSDYFNMDKKDELNEKFVFVNIGMYARLDNIKIPSGKLCIPVETYSMTIDNNTKVIKDKLEFTDDILLKSNYKFDRIKLIGIDDTMPFVTTTDYKLTDFFNSV
jgi:hypothetical protein